MAATSHLTAEANGSSYRLILPQLGPGSDAIGRHVCKGVLLSGLQVCLISLNAELSCDGLTWQGGIYYLFMLGFFFLSFFLCTSYDTRLGYRSEWRKEMVN